MLLSKLWYMLASASFASASVLRLTSSLLPTRNLFQFSKTGTWLENIAVRPGGDLLVTMLSPTASLYTLKRPYSPNRTLSLLHTFDNATGLLGITETTVDAFAVLSIKFGDDSALIPGSSAVWGVSFDRDDRLYTRKIASIPDIIVPNGITSIPGTSAIFVTDSMGGTITRCDTQAGTCRVILSGPETAPSPGSSEPTGANGIHYRSGYLYWSNSNLVSIFRVRLGEDGCLDPHANIETVGKIDAVFIDDFAEDNDGRFWIAAGENNTMVALRSDGSSEVVAGSLTEPTVAGCTSAAFGRTVHDHKTLYVTTNGGSSTPVHGVVEPAKIVAMDTSAYV
ncbi:hypothetical protein GGR51DRAFT_553620 [Nemania sp. FL0031]|nr:hypothetical protein GGR51DRAFT_553620 [Nemania sp. FL0031]